MAVLNSQQPAKRGQATLRQKPSQHSMKIVQTRKIIECCDGLILDSG
nr:MAG TPA: hypothetical protein [Siphoviridae sp. ct8LQ5]